MDNAKINLKAAKSLDNSQIGCCSHKLNLEVKQMLEHHLELKETTLSVQNTMREVNSKRKSAAVLRNFTDLHPILDNATRWSRKVKLLRKFTEVHGELVEAISHNDAEFTVAFSVEFFQKVQKYHNTLKEIDIVTKSLKSIGK